MKWAKNSLRGSLQHLLSMHDPAPAEIYTLSLHDALPIYWIAVTAYDMRPHILVDFTQDKEQIYDALGTLRVPGDRKSTRLNSSHSSISYAVFCLKKKTSTHRRRPLDRNQSVL